MTEPPPDRSDFWVNFTCVFVVSGVLFALLAWEYLTRIDSPLTVVIAATTWLLVTTAISFFTARHGEADSSPPQDSFEFRIRFICSFVAFGIPATFVVLRESHRIDSPAVVGISWLLMTTATSIYAARHGDGIWRKILNFLRY